MFIYFARRVVWEVNETQKEKGKEKDETARFPFLILRITDTLLVILHH
jgi:hypothetical protein